MTHARSADRGPRTLFADPGTDGRFLSRGAARALADRVFGMGRGGGFTRVTFDSRWSGNLRWARNDITTGGDTQQSNVDVSRTIRGASGGANTNALDDAPLRAICAKNPTYQAAPKSPRWRGSIRFMAWRMLCGFSIGAAP